MKITKTIIVAVLLAALVATLGGCSGSSDALLRFNLNGELLPNMRGYAGKKAVEADKKAGEETTNREVSRNAAKTPENVARLMNGF